ncbi:MULTISPECIES: strictosidine synthase [Ramlibacter]|uniref:Strictosidine synthase n=1 Tax=Ramlibacter aquaticus TaxID=2780094 RepID=A0ABR9SBI9_9BURK|nr:MULTISPECIES: strictosidine synthase [Ramlibacter]MBE7939705.1 strictosidine synthase [Ramlibacter aquaticus]
MLSLFRQWADQVLGRGHAAITVPVMDGALKPNRALDEAQVLAAQAGLCDLASDGRRILVAAGPRVLEWDGQALQPLLEAEAPLTALALGHDGRLAIAVEGRSVQVLVPQGTAWTEVARLAQAGGGALVGVNALAWDSQGRLLATEGSRRYGPADWCQDLMSLGRSGRVLRWTPGTGGAEVLADRLAHAFGAAEVDGRVWFSESWAHRVRETAGAVSAELVGYPSRLAPAPGGGAWVSCFVCRSQLVEFVLREHAYRRRMLAEVDPRYWIAPALSSGHSFLEPLQGAGVKQMGVLKPWAPPRSYGLVLRLAPDGRITRSLHSQVDGRHHGISAVAQVGSALYAVSQGAGRLLRLDLGSEAGEAA